MDLSNKSLALMLLAAVVVSLGGTLLSLQKITTLQENPTSVEITGQASDTGTTNLSIEDQVGCAVRSNIDFGSSSVTGVTIDSDTNNDNYSDCQNNDCEMILNNTGNVNVSVNFSSDTGGTSLFESTSSGANDFNYSINNGTEQGGLGNGGCTNTTSFFGSSIDNNVQTTEDLVCNNFYYADGQDALHAEYRLHIPSDEGTGEKKATITFECNQV